MWWQGVPLLHAAVLPLALGGDALARIRPRRVVALAWGWSGGALLIALVIAFAGPRHRCGGEQNIVIPLRHDHPMLHDLRIHATCPIPVVPSGWWPDVLPEPAEADVSAGAGVAARERSGS
jgi:hypothetical protein